MDEVLHKRYHSSQMWPCLCPSVQVYLHCTASGAGKSLHHMRTASHMPHMCMVLVHNVFPGGHPDAKYLSRCGHIGHTGEPSGSMNLPGQDTDVTLPWKCSAQTMSLHLSPQGNNLGRSEPLLRWLESLPLRQVLSAFSCYNSAATKDLARALAGGPCHPGLDCAEPGGSRSGTPVLPRGRPRCPGSSPRLPAPATS